MPPLARDGGVDALEILARPLDAVEQRDVTGRRHEGRGRRALRLPEAREDAVDVERRAGEVVHLEDAALVDAGKVPEPRWVPRLHVEEALRDVLRPRPERAMLVGRGDARERQDDAEAVPVGRVPARGVEQPVRVRPERERLLDARAAPVLDVVVEHQGGEPGDVGVLAERRRADDGRPAGVSLVARERRRRLGGELGEEGRPRGLGDGAADVEEVAPTDQGRGSDGSGGRSGDCHHAAGSRRRRPRRAYRAGSSGRLPRGRDAASQRA
jgi:hypothetical protein